MYQSLFMNRIYSVCFILILSVVLSACLSESANPLSNPMDASQDERLFGTWRCAQEGDVAYLHFGRNLNGATDIVMVEHGKEDDIDVSTYTMFPTRIANFNYMNLREVRRGDSHEGNSGYIFVKYLVRNKRLTLWLLNDEKIRESVASGNLRGDVKKGWLSAPMITDTPARIIDYITSTSPNELFWRLADFEKVVSK